MEFNKGWLNPVEEKKRRKQYMTLKIRRDELNRYIESYTSDIKKLEESQKNLATPFSYNAVVIRQDLINKKDNLRIVKDNLIATQAFIDTHYLDFEMS